MASGVVRYITIMTYAIAVLLLVFGLAVKAQMYWGHSWIVCVITLLVSLMCLLFSGDSDVTQLSVRKVFRPYRARKAARQSQKRPMFGRSDDNPHLNGEDRPLPKYLAHRVAVYVQKRRKTDPIQFRKDVNASSTFNALVRKEFKAGRI
ncbi:MAG: hypothetical protein JSW58_06585 [Candidatus Latescibacterota bacterium]|nr:MAG: hypothetical protein JSW58_06585 [Candidatus Latescibacterota bacterium]